MELNLDFGEFPVFQEEVEEPKPFKKIPFAYDMRGLKKQVSTASSPTLCLTLFRP